MTRIVCLLLVALLSATSHAGSGEKHSLPLRAGVKLKHKLRLNIDARWIDGTGYRPVRLEAVPTPGPAAAERTIQVVLEPGYSRKRIETTIKIEPGARSASKTVLLPQDEIWHTMSVEVYENGEPIRELFEPFINYPRTYQWNWTEASPAMLWVDADVPNRASRDLIVNAFRSTGIDNTPTHKLPDFRNLVRSFPECLYTGQMVPADGSLPASDLELLSQMSDVARADMLSLADVPENWLELTSADLVFISLDDLKELAATRPQRFASLKSWLYSGPVLCVTGVGDEFERLEELERVLKLAPRPSLSQQPDRYRGWIVPDNKLRFADIGHGYADGFSQTYGVAAEPLGDGADFSGGQAPPKVWPFVVRDAGLGYVAALGAENPYPGEASYWKWLLNTVPEGRWMWFRRHGMSLQRTNNDFWNFLIPGVGRAPVVSFLLLISLFAVFIGPVNYVILSRWRRLYLLLITVPAGAALVTLSLFMYAVITDGIGVRTRVRSFTELDQRDGRAATWSRQSYYASIAPSGGLRFPTDAAVYPLVHEPTSRSGQRTTGHELAWSESQTLREGYLFSRTPAQFLVVRSAPTESKLIVQVPRDGGPPRVQNRLGVAIRYLVVADRRPPDPEVLEPMFTAPVQGAQVAMGPKQYLWAGGKLPVGGAVELESIATAKARDRLSEIYGSDPIDYPEGYNPALHNAAMDWMFPDIRRYLTSDMGSGEPATSTSVLERNLAPLMRSPTPPLAPGTFLAVVERPAEVPLGVEGAREEASLHVIRGRW